MSHVIEGKQVSYYSSYLVNLRQFECKQVVSERQAKAEALNMKGFKVFLGGISTGCNEKDLVEYFAAFGIVERAVINREHGTEKHRGSGFVIFNDPSSAKKVLEKTDHKLKGKNF